MTQVSEAARQKVRERANGACEYCLKPDVVSTHDFHIDHIIPPAHHGSDELDNLAWSCGRCNRYKGRDIASIDLETGHLTMLFNPRKQEWGEHFEKQQFIIVGKTPHGRVTITLLQLNDETQLRVRKNLATAGLW